MKTPAGIRNFLNEIICISTSLAEAVQMVAVMEAIIGLGLIFHGSYLCTSVESNQKIFGVLYAFSGITFWVLTWILWKTSDNPTLVRCRVWIMGSILNQLSVLALTIARNAVGSKNIQSANIWIVCGLFLQVYMTAVVWSFMLHTMRGRANNSPVNTDPVYTPNIPKGEDNSILTDDSSTIDRNSTVVSL